MGDRKNVLCGLGLRVGFRYRIEGSGRKAAGMSRSNAQVIGDCSCGLAHPQI